LQEIEWKNNVFLFTTPNIYLKNASIKILFEIRVLYVINIKLLFEINILRNKYKKPNIYYLH